VKERGRGKSQTDETNDKYISRSKYDNPVKEMDTSWASEGGQRRLGIWETWGDYGERGRRESKKRKEKGRDGDDNLYMGHL